MGQVPTYTLPIQLRATQCSRSLAQGADGSSPEGSSLPVCAVRQSFLQPALHHGWLHLVPMSTLKLVQWLQCTVHV